MEIDITGDRECFVNYDHCFVKTFLGFHMIPDIVEIAFDKLALDINTMLSTDSGDDYISPKFEEIFGISLIRFELPSYIETTLALYNESGQEFLLDSTGTVIQLERKWGDQNSTDMTYHLGGICDWPNGDYNIEIRTSKPVTLFTPPDFMNNLGGIVT